MQRPKGEKIMQNRPRRNKEREIKKKQKNLGLPPKQRFF